MVLVADNKAPKILDPGKKTFDLPSAKITPKLSAILGFLFAPFLAMRRDHFNPAIIQKFLIKAIAVVCFIPNEPVRRMLGETAVDGCLHQRYFMGRSAFHVSGDRKTSSVCDCHDLGALATLCLADSKTPFFAGTKVPSMKASRISIPPRSYRSCASSWVIRAKTPWRTHCWNRLWHVWYGGYLGGKSFQGAPVLKIQKIPSMTWRGSRARRPRGSLGGVAESIMGSIRFHCSSVSSILILLHNQELMSRYLLYYVQLFFEMASSKSRLKVSPVAGSILLIR